MMEALNAKEFFEQLGSNTLKPLYYLQGLVQPSDKTGEVLFTHHGSNHWVKIPQSMVLNVHVMKVFTQEGKTTAAVKMRLKEPATPEGKMLFQLLPQTDGCNCGCGGNCSCGGHCNCAHGGGGCHCGCGCGCNSHQGHCCCDGGCCCGCNCGCQNHQSGSQKCGTGQCRE